MALTADEQKLLDELTQKSKEPDADADFEIEIFSGDRGARIPYRHGEKWLRDNFGIGLPDADADGGQGDGDGQGDGQGKRAGGKRAPAGKSAEPTPLSSYFGKRTAAK
jgi:hypothetical protein